jgi:hypothetical protein
LQPQLQVPLQLRLAFQLRVGVVLGLESDPVLLNHLLRQQSRVTEVRSTVRVLEALCQQALKQIHTSRAGTPSATSCRTNALVSLDSLGGRASKDSAASAQVGPCPLCCRHSGFHRTMATSGSLTRREILNDTLQPTLQPFPQALLVLGLETGPDQDLAFSLLSVTMPVFEKLKNDRGSGKPENPSGSLR